MKLSKLVQIRNDINSLVLSEYEFSLNQSLNSLKIHLENQEKSSSDVTNTIVKSQENINLEFSNIRQTIQDYRNYVESCVRTAEPTYYAESDRIYQDSIHDDATYILNRRKESLTLADDNNKELFVSRLGMYNSWKYPAIELRPAFGEITDYIKGCDPLYLLDTDQALFSEIQNKYNEIYQRRLRYYTINETDTNMLADLPDDQFGLIVSVDYFNFKPLHIIENFLKEFYSKLKPGGVVMFTYNNCDLPFAVRNVENKFCCYTPGHTVKQTAQKLGFDILKSVDQLENISWLEIQKPGELTSIRGGQTLGEIRSFD